jgi:hypothetical protein
VRTRLPSARGTAPALTTPPALSPRAPLFRAPRPASPDADLARASHFGHRFDAPPAPGLPSPALSLSSASAPIQRGGKDKDPTETTSLLSDQHAQLIDEATKQLTAASKLTTGQQVLSGVSKLGSAAQLGSRGVEFTKAATVPSALGSTLGATSSSLAAGASIAEGLATLKQAATGGEKIKDKALLGLEATSSFANATLSGASALRHAGSAGTALSVAGPAAIAMGGADLIGGLGGTFVAAHREGQLAGIEQQQNDGTEERSIARFAKESQRTKKWRNLGNVLKGGLAVGGGIALLAGAGPVGWGLLTGAALVGGGVTAYKMYRKHKLGKQLRGEQPDRPSYMGVGQNDADTPYRQGFTNHQIYIPDNEYLQSESRTKRWFNTKSSRTYDLVRAQIAQRLKEKIDIQGGGGTVHGQIVGHLGLRNETPDKVSAKDIARQLDG